MEEEGSGEEEQQVAEFGWEDAPKKLTGRRKKLQKKVKPGSFGKCRTAAACARHAWRSWAKRPAWTAWLMGDAA